MKKIIIAIVFIIILLICAIWSPWLSWNLTFGQLLGLGTKPSYSGLKIFSLVGEVDAYLDNEYIGTISPETGCLDDNQISPGTHEVKITRKSDPAGSYYELVKNINFEIGIDVIISYELGPSKEFSEGHIFYAEKSFIDTNKSKLNVTSVPDKSKLYLDDIFIGETPLFDIDIDLSSQHKIKLVHDGYDTIEFKILPESQEDRDKLKGYKLNLEINMFLIPIKL